MEMTQQLYMSNGNSATTPNEEDSTKSSTTPLSPTESSDTTPSTPATPATPATPSANLKIVQSINTGRNEINEAVDAITQQLPHKLMATTTKIGSKLKYLNMNRSLMSQSSSDLNTSMSEAWNSEHLKEKLRKKEEENQILFEDESAETHFAHMMEECEQKENERLIHATSSSLLFKNNTSYIYQNASVIPLCVPLRSKKHKKCLACLQNKTTTYLVKSVANPLKGDSYNMKIKDSWYSVQSFAIETFPILSLLQPFPQVTEDRFRIRIMNPCNIHGSLVQDAIEIHLSQYSTPDTNCKVQFPATISVPGMDPATYTESTEPQELPEFVESIGPNYVILYTYIEREEDVPPLFYLKLECTINEQDKKIDNTIIYKVQLP